LFYDYVTIANYYASLLEDWKNSISKKGSGLCSESFLWYNKSRNIYVKHIM
jgi:hypothetical protein